MGKIYVLCNIFGAIDEQPMINIEKAYLSEDEAKKIAEEKEKKDKEIIVNPCSGIDYSHWEVYEAEIIE